MSITGVKEYRLLRKKDGTYVLQVKKDYYRFDEQIRGLVYGIRWEDVETAEESDEKDVN